MGLFLFAVRCRRLNAFLDNMRTAVCRLLREDELPDLTVLPSSSLLDHQQTPLYTGQITHQRWR